MAGGGVGRGGGVHILLAHRPHARRAAFDFRDQPKASPAQRCAEIPRGWRVGEAGTDFVQRNGALGGIDLRAHIDQNFVEDRFQGFG